MVTFPSCTVRAEHNLVGVLQRELPLTDQSTRLMNNAGSI